MMSEAESAETSPLPERTRDERSRNSRREPLTELVNGGMLKRIFRSCYCIRKRRLVGRIGEVLSFHAETCKPVKHYRSAAISAV